MELSDTIHLLGDILGQVLVEQETQALFEVEERVRALAKDRRSMDLRVAQVGENMLAAEVANLDEDTAWAIAGAFALYFDLVNTAEDIHRIGALRQEGREKSPAPVHDSIEEAVAQLKASGVDAGEMQALLDRLQIELVLTAHPTEARRRTILSKLQRIGETLNAINQPGCLPEEVEKGNQSLRNEITSIWLTDRARTSQPTPNDEVKTTLFFVGEVFWTALPEIYARLENAVDKYYPGLRVEHPWLRLASWIGGDRDGNPNVTSLVTAETLHLHRGLAVENHRRTMQDLSRRLSISDLRIPLPDALRVWLDDRPRLPAHASQIQQRYPNEPYRLILALLAADLAEASLDDMKGRLITDLPHTARICKNDLYYPLQIIEETLPGPLKQGPLQTALRQLEIFDLYGARLDIREDSDRINTSLSEVLRALNLCPDYQALDVEARQALLLELLAQPVPLLSPRPGVSPDAAETWALFKLIQRTRQIYGPELLGPFIVSMSHSASDVLAVLLMARWCGCDEGLMIVPLFETIRDLESASSIMENLFTLPVYQRHLETCPEGQIVMVGYSDSNKDGGFVMSNWALYQAQETVTRVCRERGVQLTLFHGRGGTAARGGGPVNRAILAQPGGSVNGHYRLTEQGENLTSRYANLDLALRNLEQIVNAVLFASTPPLEQNPAMAPVEGFAPVHFKLLSPRSLPSAWRRVIDGMASAACSAYRDLVYDTPGFMEYWRWATPLEEIKHLQIGSRPASRKPDLEQVTQIRAIPWVFSWMQSRFNLPGWYGLGSGLEAAQANHPDGLHFLQEMYASWSFLRTLLESAELSLMKADLQIAALYSSLVPDQELAQRIFTVIQQEYQRTVHLLLLVKGQEQMLQDEPVIQRGIQVRNPYVDPLNYLQVEMLRRLRALPDQDSPQALRLRQVILLTISGIAAGLRNTG